MLGDKRGTVLVIDDDQDMRWAIRMILAETGIEVPEASSGAPGLDNQTDPALCIRSLKKHYLADDLIWVKDGAEALEFLFARCIFAGRDVNHVPKMVLLGLRLPRFDGLEVLRQIRANERLKSTPVFVLTSSKDDRDVVKSYMLGATIFANKPVDFDEFPEAIAKLAFHRVLINKPPCTRT